MRAAFSVSRSALVLNLSSKVGNTNSVKDINYNITIVTNVAGCISVVVDLNLVRKTLVASSLLHRI